MPKCPKASCHPKVHQENVFVTTLALLRWFLNSCHIATVTYTKLHTSCVFVPSYGYNL